MRIPMNRVVAFAGPYISAAAGLVAAWLVAKVNVTGLPGLDENNLRTTIAFLLTQGVVTGVTWLGHQAWLKGHHITLEGDAKVQAAAIAAASMPTDPPSGAPVTALPLPDDPDDDDHDSDDELEPGEDLVDDDEEFASPPPAAEPTVVQPSQSGLVEPEAA